MNKRTVPGDVPGCDSGPGGRLKFVVGEIREAWSARRRRRADGIESAVGADTATDTGTSAHATD
ncbi:MAG: hypothetical protein LC789_11680 [Actinobacteria bacterium]|nr:hypothetical protein [Actinomycetota bacterium]